MSPKEAELRNRDCTLAPPVGKMMLDGTEFAVAQLPAMDLLKLVSFDSSFSNDQSGRGVHQLKLLPYGGLWYRDNCDLVVFSDDGENAVIAVRVRPGLSLADEYPASYKQIRDAGQMLRVKSRSYLVFPYQPLAELDEFQQLLHSVITQRLIFTQREGRPEFAHDSYALWTRGAFFVPLKQP